jgi:phage terminase large subunit
MRIKLLRHQYDAVYSKHKHTLLAGGVGSGKSFAGTHFVIKNLATQPQTQGLIVANTYQQLRDVSVAALFVQFAEVGIPYQFNKNEMSIQVGPTTILCRSAEKHENWKGIEVGFVWFDEAAYAKPQAYETILARLRHPKATKHQTLLTTTPKGFNWVHEYYIGSKKTAEHHMIQAKTASNRHLPPDYSESLRSQYDDLLSAQELEGEFVNVTAGRIYYAFKREENVGPVDWDRGYPLWAGLDFNIDPMAGVIGQVIPTLGGHKLHIIDEFFLRNSNTEAMSKAIKAKYGPEVTIVPDSTGIKRTTNANVSDIHILKTHFTRVSPGINPFRVDRYASVNGAFANGLVVINPRCENLIRDLETVAYKKGSNEPETSSHLLTHISDALGYLIYKTVNPLRSGTQKIQSQLR